MSNDRYLLDAAFEDHRQQYQDVTDLGDAFEIFTADYVLRRRKLSIDEIRNAVVGGNKDGGLDSIFIFVNGRLIEDVSALPDTKSDVRIEVFFFQSKHSIDIEQVVLQKLKTSLDLFLNLEPNQSKLDKQFNSDLQDKATLYRSVIQKYMMLEYKVRYRVVYCCRSANNPNDTFQDLADELVEMCNKQLGPADTSFEFYGAQRLYKVSVQQTHKKRTHCPTCREN